MQHILPPFSVPSASRDGKPLLTLLAGILKRNYAATWRGVLLLGIILLSSLPGLGQVLYQSGFEGGDCPATNPIENEAFDPVLTYDKAVGTTIGRVAKDLSNGVNREPRTGCYAGLITNEGTNTQTYDGSIITQLITFEPGYDYRVEVFAKVSTTANSTPKPGSLRIMGIPGSLAPTNANATNSAARVIYAPSGTTSTFVPNNVLIDTYTSYAGTFSVTATTQYYIAFKLQSPSVTTGAQSKDFMIIDDINISFCPTTTLPALPTVCSTYAPFNLSGGLPAGGVYSGTGVTTPAQNGTANYQFDPSLAGVGTFTITYTAPNAPKSQGNSACPISAYKATQPITVTAPTTLAALNPVCLDAGAFTLSGGAPAGGVYSGTGVTSSTQNGVTTYQFNPATAGIGTKTITYTANGCSASQSILVKSTTLAAFSSVCANAGAFVLTGGLPEGGVYSGTGVTSPAQNGTGGYQFDPALAGAGTRTITYTADGCAASRSITVIAAPTLAAFTAICEGTSRTLSGGGPAGGVYSSPTTGAVTQPTAGTYVFNAAKTLAPGTYQIDYTTSCGTASQTITITPLPTLAAFSDICVNAEPLILTGGAPAGGVYSGTGVSLVGGSYQFNPATAGTGGKTITYTVNGCSASQGIMVKAIALTAFTDVCANAAPFQLTGGSPAGGVYSGDGVTSSTLNGVTTYQFNPATAGIGTKTITYTANDCSVSRSIVVKTTILPAFGDVCLNAAAFPLNSGSPSGGIYSGPGVTGSNGVYQFTPSAAGVGTHTIQYSANGCSTSQSITVKEIALASLSDICVNAPALVLTGGSPAGGVYSGTGVSLVSGSYRFNPATVGEGTHTITYTVNGCSATQPINVRAISLAAFNDVCLNASFLTLSGGLPAGGAYSGKGVTLVNGTYRFTPSAAGVGTFPITYTVNECSATQNITVKDISLAAFAAVCANAAPFELTGGAPIGGVYTGTGVAYLNGKYMLDPAVGGTGSRNITYAINGCSATQSINVKPIAFPAFSDVCANASAFILTTGSPAGGVYSGTGVTVNNGVYQFTPTSVAAGTYPITYAVNGCSATQSITVKAIALTAFNAVCANTAAFTLTGGSPAGGVYSGTGVTESNGVYKFNPAAVGDGTYTIYYAVNGCSVSRTITVKEISLAAFPDVCANESAFTLTGGLPTGGIYSGPGVTAIGNSGSYRFTPSTSLVGKTNLITYTINGCSASQLITVKAVPTLAAYSPICQSTSLTLNTGTPTGGVYSSPTAGAITQPTAGTYVFNAAKTLAAGTYQITYQATNGCAVSQPITVIATPTLAALSTMCQSDAAITLSGGAPAGGAYSGPGVSSSIVNGVTTYQFSPTGAGAGVHTISYTTSCGVATRSLTVIATPTLAAFAKPVCINGTLALTGANPAGGTWSGPGVTGSTFSAAAALQTGSGPFIITYTTGCGSTSQSLAVTNTTTWTGEVSSNWFDARNWTACVPDPTINGIVPVPSGSRPYPVISGATGEVLTLTVSGKWTLPGGNLDLYGDFDTSGGGTFEQKAGTFTLKGINQAIAGATFYNLTSGTAGIKTLTGTVSVTNLLNMQVGVMETSANYMADLGTTGSISETDASYVLGRVRSIRTVPASGTQAFGNIGLALAVNSGLSPGTTTVLRVTGPNTAQTGLPGSTSILRYFDVSATGANLTAPPMDMTATFAYRDAELNGIAESSLALFRSTNNGVSWGRVGGTLSEADNRFVGVRLASLGRLTLGDKGMPLPVSLISFSARRQQQTTLLNWSTASEKNNDGFSVETSHNGVNFQSIGFVKSVTGNSQTVQNYSFVDRANRPAGVQYYRLQQLDLDGKAGYSPVQTVVVQAGGLQMSAYPNPFQGTLTVDVSLVANSPVTIVMHDALGREVYRTSTKTLPAGTHSLLVAPDTKAQGMYMLNISTNNGPTQHIRVVQQ